MKEFIRDIFTEDKNDNKFSSKKTMGIIAGILTFCAFVVDGFHFYDIDTDLFNSMLIFSGTMLGASVVKVFGKQKPKAE
jgi:glycopeptide antibiotics resistance protein